MWHLAHWNCLAQCKRMGKGIQCGSPTGSSVAMLKWVAGIVKTCTVFTVSRPTAVLDARKRKSLYWFRSKCGWRLYLVSDSRLTPTATTGAHDAQHHPHKQHNHMQQHIPAIQPRRASQPRPRGKHIAQPRHPLFTVNQSAPRLARRLALIRLVGTGGG